MLSKGKYRPEIPWILAAALGALFAFWFLTLAPGLRIDVPFADGDAYLTLAVIKGLLEGKWWPYGIIKNSDLNAPFGLNMSDFPSTDPFQFLILKVLGAFIGSSVLTLNIYYLLTFALCAAAFYASARVLKISRLVSCVLAVLYSLLPYHQLRYAHLFLSGYFMVPIFVTLALKLWDEPYFFYQGKDINLSTPLAVMALLCGAVGAGCGLYYSYFFCILALISGAAAGFQKESWQPAVAAAILVACVAVFTVANFTPCLVDHWVRGPNHQAIIRYRSESEFHGLRLTSILMPWPWHRIRLFTKLKAAYQSGLPAGAEGLNEYFGVVASFGFVFLIGAFLLKKRRGDLIDRLSLLATGSVLLSIAGGFAYLMTYLIGKEIRCYNRISIFLATLSLFAVGVLLTKLEARFKSPQWIGILLAILTFGLVDQTAPIVGEGQGQVASEYDSDAEFVSRIEKSQPPGGTVLELPFQPFPEFTSVGKMGEYSQFRGYLHSTGLKWSYGAVRGRPEAAQTLSFEGKPVEEIRKAGYTGIWIDRRGYTDEGKKIEASLVSQLGVSPEISKNGHLVFFNLLPAAK